MCAAPGCAPRTTIIRIGIVIPIRIIAFDIGEIKQNLIIRSCIRAYLVVALMQITIDPAPIQVASHVDERHIRIVLLQTIH